MIKAIKFFLVILFVSSAFVWLTNNPAIITVNWNNYLIRTNSFGFVLFIFFLIVSIIFTLFVIRKVRDFPRELRISKQSKNIKLANKSLDSLAHNLFTGNIVELKKDSRKIKKYLNNSFFSNFLLFQSALVENNIDEARKFLKILKTDQEFDYLTRRAEIIILNKEKNTDEAIRLLEKCCEDYNTDDWFHEKLSTIYSLNKDWEKAHSALDKIKKITTNENREKLANLKVLSKGNVVEALTLSKNSILVTNENIKHYIDNSNLKKASKLLIKSWPNFLCFELMETYINYKTTKSKECLARYKLIAKPFKKSINIGGNETKLSLAFACFKSSLWGEAQNFLDQIEKKNWDKRVLELYKKISDESEKIKFDYTGSITQECPLWICSFCGSKHQNWQYICSNCNSIDSIQWSKIKNKSNAKVDIYFEFLKNSFRQLPKMK